MNIIDRIRKKRQARLMKTGKTIKIEILGDGHRRTTIVYPIMHDRLLDLLGVENMDDWGPSVDALMEEGYTLQAAADFILEGELTAAYMRERDNEVSSKKLDDLDGMLTALTGIG